MTLLTHITFPDAQVAIGSGGESIDLLTTDHVLFYLWRLLIEVTRHRQLDFLIQPSLPDSQEMHKSAKIEADFS
jgi:hypothetical protein